MCEGRSVDTRPEQPPEGALIAEALTHSGMSIRRAASLAGISYGRWRQITSGYQNVSHGSYGKVHAPPDTLARMARAVGVTAEQLEGAGRDDAADALRNLGSTTPGGALPDILPGFTEDETRIARAFVAFMRSQQDEQERGA
jgi:hypothetical protein